jgi:predicted P-loop ATPase
MQGKESFEQLGGAWLVEVGELAGMKKADAESIKQYISKQSDRYRPAYGRRLQEFPRQCIFIATTNESQFLRDMTGNRRFWVVDTPNKPALDMWDELTPEVVSLIWGEAVHFYKQGEKLYLSKELEAVAREVQELYEEENPKVGLVAQYLERLLPEDWESKDSYSRRAWLESGELGTVPRETVCTMELWVEALGQNPDRFDRYATKEVREIMEKIPEWRHQGNAKLSIKPYGRQRYYKKEE